MSNQDEVDRAVQEINIALDKHYRAYVASMREFTEQAYLALMRLRDDTPAKAPTRPSIGFQADE